MNDTGQVHDDDKRDRHHPDRYACEEPETEEYTDEADLELILPLKTDWELDKIPESDLTPEEDILPPEHRRLRVLIAKCKLVGCWNVYNLDYLVGLLTPPNRTVGGADYSYRDVVVNHVIGPQEFYLTWLVDSDKSFLMWRWLTATIMEQDVTDGIKVPSTDDLIGKLVCAIYDPSGLWQRAKVVDIRMGGRTAVLFYIDNGLTREMDMVKVRPLPKELACLPAYAMRCKLSGVNFNAENLKDDATSKEFNWEVGTSEFFKCKLRKYGEETDTYSVALRLVQGDGAPRNFNYVVRKKYEMRKYIEAKLKEEPEPDSNRFLLTYNREVDVESSLRFKMKGLRMFRVTQANSPSDFCVEYIVDCVLPTGMTAWQQEMNLCYSHPKMNVLYKLSTCRPLVSRCYVVHSGSLFGWQRCRAIERQDDLNLCKIILVDTGMLMLVPFEALHELEPKYSHSPAKGFRAYLMDIIPTEGASDWSEEANTRFSKMVVGELFHGIIIQRSDAPCVTPICPQLNFMLGLVLVRRSTDSQPQEQSINAQLCAINLAEPTGIAGGGMFPNYKDKVFEFEDMRQALFIDDPTVEVNMLDLNAKREEASDLNPSSLSGNALKMKTMVKMNSKDQPHPALDFYKTYLHSEEAITRNMLNVPKEIRNSLSICLVTFISSPSCFYVQTMQKVAQLKPMMRYIEAQVDSMPALQPGDIVNGMDVAVFLFDEQEDPAWYRGIIRTVIYSILLAKVILVDYGTEVSVKFSAIRHLPKYFSSIPGLAQRVHLDVRNLIPMGGPTCPGWSTAATDTFRRYLAIWQADNPVYFIWRQPGSSVIELDHYGQELSYDHKSAVWKKRMVGIPMVEEDLTIERLDKERTLLQNMCRSVGVDLVYETITEPDAAYKFDKAWDILIHVGLATMKM